MNSSPISCRTDGSAEDVCRQIGCPYVADNIAADRGRIIMGTPDWMITESVPGQAFYTGDLPIVIVLVVLAEVGLCMAMYGVLRRK